MQDFKFLGLRHHYESRRQVELTVCSDRYHLNSVSIIVSVEICRGVAYAWKSRRRSANRPPKKWDQGSQSKIDYIVPAWSKGPSGMFIVLSGKVSLDFGVDGSLAMNHIYGRGAFGGLACHSDQE